jgi:hypothetical protein
MPTETNIKQAIRDYLRAKGIHNFHLLQGLGAYAGLPDRMAILKGKDGISYTLYIEAKNHKNVQSENQVAFQQAVEKAGGCYILARSVDDVIKVVEAILNGNYKQT